MSLLHPRQFLRVVVLICALLPVGRGRGADVVPLAGAAAQTNAPVAAKLPPVTPLTLTNLLVAPENRDWQAQGLWQTVPHGRTNDFAGVRFWLEGPRPVAGQTLGGGEAELP